MLIVRGFIIECKYQYENFIPEATFHMTKVHIKILYFIVQREIYISVYFANFI